MATVEKISLYNIVLLFLLYIVSHLILMGYSKRRPDDKTVAFLTKWWAGIYVVFLVAYLTFSS